nr:ParB/RepB/Spo0J family partition protein [uncultured Dyadobacter sp.]
MKTNHKSTTQRKATKAALSTERIIQAAELRRVPAEQIEISRFNYRKHFDQNALDEFAAELAIHGVLSPLLVRRAGAEGYELIAGERRLRAARIAGLAQLPVLLAELTDEQAREVQLVENLQRENPHPLDEAQAIEQMQQSGKSIDEIAARLGKSKKFVYTRIKLSGLIEPHQKILMAAKMGVQQAYEIASLSPPTQQEIYNHYCEGWQDEHFRMPSGHQISRFRCDLASAPFDTNDSELLSDKGACTSCPLNSAALDSLFPELAGKATCSGWECFQRKRGAHLTRKIKELTQDFQPQAIVYTHTSQLDEIAAVLSQFETLGSLPQYAKWGLSEIVPPRMPERGHYIEPGSQDLTDDAEQLFAAALDDFEADLTAYEAVISSADCMAVILISDHSVRTGYFRQIEKSITNGQTLASAKQYQLAARQGTLTRRVVESEIDRLTAKEHRSKELDQEKIQLVVHSAFLERFTQLDHQTPLTDADQVAVRLIVFQSLDYHVRYQLAEALGFSGQALEKEQFFSTLASLSPAQFAFLVRLSLAGNSASKHPDNITGWCLREVASSAGLDVQAIEQARQQVSGARQAKFEQRLAELAAIKTELLQTESA